MSGKEKAVHTVSKKFYPYMLWRMVYYKKFLARKTMTGRCHDAMY